MSSISMSLFLDYFPVISNKVLSFKPSFSSGIPVRETLILTAPKTSERNTVPLDETSMFNFSMTSRNTSFLLYLILSGRHPTALLAAVGTANYYTSLVIPVVDLRPAKPFFCTNLLASVLMYSCKTFTSVICG